ncbi:hypothetical protein [Streptomyces sp. NBC_00557]|uniref:hypothetical protein n=1 Tax=Streptomyces sp. NBC_00557 TaxID=2975776 RepID=UPI002E80F215|nr:hypothetical protein [Streptomyces sp. NBC_00557]WUC32755.1 FAD:protein FMN transferase [Streptomyces sp. NBC_00557]
MLADEGLAALAAAGGAAVVQAAAGDAWEAFRGRLARWFGRGDEERERSAALRLEQTARVLRSGAAPGEADTVRIAQAAAWQARFEAVLEELDGPELDRGADQLRSLLAEHGVRPGLVQAGGDIVIKAGRGSVAAAVVQGDVHIGRPTPPDPAQG